MTRPEIISPATSDVMFRAFIATWIMTDLNPCNPSIEVAEHFTDHFLHILFMRKNLWLCIHGLNFWLNRLITSLYPIAHGAT